jgi:hypothetical protein
MPGNVKLSDTQLVLLSTAAQRENGSALPVAASIAAKPPQLEKCFESLLERELISEVVVITPAETWREADDQRVGLAITEAGKKAIGIGFGDPGVEPVEEAQGSPPETGAAVLPSESGRGAKQALLIEMLARSDGASINEIGAATNWLPHSARAMLTGLRKRGLTITSEKVDGVRRYCAIAEELK